MSGVSRYNRILRRWRTREGGSEWRLGRGISCSRRERVKRRETTTGDKELRAAGVVDEAQIAQEVDNAGFAAMAKTAPAILLYWGAGKLAGGLAARLAGKDASALMRAGAGFAGAEVANVGTGTVIRLLTWEDWKPTVESLTVDTLFAVMHGLR